MGALKDLIKKIDNGATIPKMESALLDILFKKEDLMTKLNRDQLMLGRDSEESFLKEYRSESYARMKASLNPKGVTDLKLTGDFHRSFLALTENWPVLFSASDKKTDTLVTNYGENIFGLDEESKNILIQAIRPKVLEYYRKLLQL